MKTWVQILIALFLLCRSGQAQGFINLNFEKAQIIADSSQGSPYVFASNAISGWTAYLGGVPQTDIIYNSRPLDAADVTLQGTNSLLSPIQGNFTVELFGASVYAQQLSAAIGQTAQIPLSAMSLLFWGKVGLTDVSFAGQILNVSQIGSTANYSIYAADISTFAGQTGQLLFTAQPGFLDKIDNIQFSTTPVPEPRALSLSALGGLFLAGLARREKNFRVRRMKQFQSSDGSRREPAVVQLSTLGDKI